MPYERGEWVYLRRVPSRTYRNDKDKKRHKMCAKLQMRWIGPYYICTVISDVLYECLVHGQIRRTHAINMKAAPGDRRTADRTGADIKPKATPGLRGARQEIKWTPLDLLTDQWIYGQDKKNRARQRSQIPEHNPRRREIAEEDMIAHVQKESEPAK